jgi:hypothetical protein
LGKKKVNSEQINEGVKDALLGALMSLSFMTPAKAQQTANALISNIPASKVAAMSQDIKSADNTADLSSIIKSYSSDTEDIKVDSNIPKPSGYKPLSVEQREDWNKYLHYLGDKAGSANLDKGAPETQGMKELKAYLQANPNSSLSKFGNPEDLIKSIQYEMKLIRGGKEFPQLTPFELKALQTLLLKNRKPFMMVHKSDSDGNPGQYTTQEYYPLFGTSADYKKVINIVYKTLVRGHNITTVDGVNLEKMIK